MKRIPIWDLPVRLGHWLLVVAFALAWLTAESERWQVVHVASGTVMAAVVLFRLVWGFVGSRHARFAAFPCSPRAAFAYGKQLLQRRAPHVAGHNPAGALAIYGLLALITLTVLSGWSTYNDVGGEAFEELHEGIATALLCLVGLHLAGVVTGSLAHGENLVRAMVTGRKQGEVSDTIASNHRGAALLLAILAALAIPLSRYL